MRVTSTRTTLSDPAFCLTAEMHPGSLQPEARVCGDYAGDPKAGAGSGQRDARCRESALAEALTGDCSAAVRFCLGRLRKARSRQRWRTTKESLSSASGATANHDTLLERNNQSLPSDEKQPIATILWE